MHSPPRISTGYARLYPRIATFSPLRHLTTSPPHHLTTSPPHHLDLSHQEIGQEELSPLDADSLERPGLGWRYRTRITGANHEGVAAARLNPAGMPSRGP